MIFADVIARWQTFYFAVGGISATLAGLVFVAIALHFQRFQQEENIPLREWSTYTVIHFAQVILISIVCLIPDQTPLGTGLPLIAGSLYGLYVFITGLMYILRHRPTIHIYSWGVYFIAPAIAYGLMAWIAVSLLVGQTQILPLMVLVVAVLLLLGGHNAWRLVLNSHIPGINSEN